MHQARHDADSYQRVEVITGRRRRAIGAMGRRRGSWPRAPIRRSNISEVARRNGVSRGIVQYLAAARRARRSREGPQLSCSCARRRAARRRPEAVDSRRFDRSGERIEVAIARRDGAGSGRRRCTHVGAGARGAEVGAVISFGPEVRVFVATQPIDFRKGVHGLVALVAEGLAGAALQRRRFRLPLEAIGPLEDFGFRRHRAGVGDQMARGRGLRLAACSRRGRCA